ncbi:MULTISPECIES: hypothetical protein [unclassified Chelatococcus]|uniref:hypothetical protein n=1 Tax=unclassified Chelatococcus TaxID=2638111 RepID=UPI001BCBB52A|nr:MULTISPECIES: hypothetical protein [unclassified Chelatococcus]CAH1672550.1 conserved hypothetical protein [Hyphomicrobiales bacterium]MBS7738937.1 hypothetical protein [Chelatococcus sp. HY11]MBX3543370.1 hypothetical protein [Chelatococcus sp.]MCO5076534.1 hypothetical protein [Chelatococcus sp.]CAH1675213.1 conserved hypothetical protein [Hyphomicrobiales bacterium]
MTAIQLLTDANEPLGFLLFANPAGGQLVAGEYGCILASFPVSVTLWDDPRGRFILDHKQREFRAVVTSDAGEITIRIDMDTGWSLELKGKGDGMRWVAQRGAERVAGKAIAGR